MRPEEIRGNIPIKIEKKKKKMWRPFVEWVPIEHRISLRLNKETADFIREYSKNKGVWPSVFIRHLLEWWVLKHKSK